jgi:outer membrane protein OmpA-like peptidoglycan-associated protein
MTAQLQVQSLFSFRRMLGLVTLSFLSLAVIQAQTLRSRVAYPKSDVTLEATAITFPNDERTKIAVLGTDRFNNLKGTAVIERDKAKAVTLIKLDIGRLPFPSQICQACGTYIVWAVTPEGQCDNLGEFRKRGSHTLDGWFGSDMETTTRHQTFSLIVTAEPYYLVSSPSRNVVATNADPSAPDNGNSLKVEHNVINFSGDSDFDNKIVSPSPTIESVDKKFPIELRQARLALEIANYYQGSKYDPKTYRASEAAYQEALEGYSAQPLNLEAVRLLADLAIRRADMARRRSISLAKAERERKQLQDRDDALASLDLSFREKERSLKEAESAKEAMSVKNHQLVSELSAAREKISQLETANADLQTANARLKTNIDALAAEKAKLESSLNELAARGDQTAKYVADLNEIRLKNRDRVSREFTLSQGEMGVVLSLPDQLFTVKQPAAIAPQALLKLDLLADYLKALNNPLLIETFGQACGSPAACQSVTDEWAQTLARYLVAQGVPQSRITAVGRGLTGPAPQPQRGRRTTAAAPPLPQVRFTIRNDSPSPSGSQ